MKYILSKTEVSSYFKLKVHFGYIEQTSGMKYIHSKTEVSSYSGMKYIHSKTEVSSYFKLKVHFGYIEQTSGMKYIHSYTAIWKFVLKVHSCDIICVFKSLQAYHAGLNLGICSEGKASKRRG